jgi:F-type H+-transporting ATPase subunit epsilon
VTLEVHLVTPEREVWVGDVEMLIAHGVDGEVGILGGHAPLLVQLAIGPLRMQMPDGAWTKAVVDGGFMHVSTEDGATRADVLASQAELESEIDVEAARRRLSELENARVEDGQGEAQAEIAKAMARISIAG